MVGVLVVDDSRSMRRLIVGILGPVADVKVLAEAEDGASAVELFEELKPDVVTLDLNLPDESGLLVLRRLLQADSDVRVVVVSGHSEQVTEDMALALGAKAYLTKPISSVALLEAIHQAAAEPPAWRPAAPVEAAEAGEQTPGVLIVEDSAPTRILLASAARLAGCRVVGPAERLSEANRLLAEETPDLVLLDLTLDDGNGLEWLAAAKSAMPLPPVVIVTAHAERDYALAAARLGVAGYLLKPVSVANVVAVLRRLLFASLL
jgi:two-component system chemotaxis response regulator CheY